MDIILTGTGSYAGSYLSTPDIVAAVSQQVADNRDICGEMGSLAVCLRFAQALGAVPDALQIIASGNHPPDLNAPATGYLQVSNGAKAVLANVAVPEPASFALLALPMGLAGLIVARRKRVTGEAWAMGGGPCGPPHRHWLQLLSRLHDVEQGGQPHVSNAGEPAKRLVQVGVVIAG